MKEILIFAAAIVIAAAFYFSPSTEVGRYQIVSGKIRELVGIKNVTQIQENNALFRIDTKSGKTWRLVPFAQATGDHTMGWEEVHEINMSAVTPSATASVPAK
jgi:hypothetical protein